MSDLGGLHSLNAMWSTMKKQASLTKVTHLSHGATVCLRSRFWGL